MYTYRVISCNTTIYKIEFTSFPLAIAGLEPICRKVSWGSRGANAYIR